MKTNFILTFLLIAFISFSNYSALGQASNSKNASDPVIMITFTWSFSNIGDIGITPGIINGIRERFPNSEIILVANSYTDQVVEYYTSRFKNVSVIRTPFISNINEPISRDVFKAIQDSPGLDQSYGTPYEYDAKIFRDAFNRSDLILYNSGTLMSYGRWRYSMSNSMKFLWPLLIAREHSKPYGLYSHSFERFAWPSNELYVPILSDAEFVFCRDGNSLEYLKESGVKSKVLEYGPDATFYFTPSSKADSYDAFMHKNGLEEKKFITLTIRSGRSKQGFLQPYGEREEMHAYKLRELIIKYIRETGNKVLVCPEVRHELEPAKELIYDQLPDDILKNVVLMDEFWLPDLAYSVYEAAETLVTMEAHSMIMGLAVGTPVLHPRFVEAGRKAWMMKDLGLEEWLFDLDDDADSISKIYSELINIHNDYDRAINKVESAMDYVSKRKKRTFDVIEEVLKSKK